MRARGWRIRTGASSTCPEPTRSRRAAARARSRARPAEFFPTGQDSATTRRWSTGSSSGGFLEPGPATVWMRMRQPLVAGEEPTPLQRTLVAADVGNGISAALDLRRFLFINVDLTVHLRADAGGRVGLRRRGHPARSRTASAPPSRCSPTSAGRIGRAAADAAGQRALSASARRPASGAARRDREAIVVAATRATAAASRKAPS